MTLEPPENVAHLVEELSLRRPFWRYFEVFRRHQHAFLLDSAQDPRSLGRFSFVGGQPFLVFKAKRVKGGTRGVTRVDIVRCGAGAGESVLYETTRNPFDELHQLINLHGIPRECYSAHPTPFLAGAVGYFGYEAAHFIEQIPDLGADDLGLPDIYMMFFDSLLVHCHGTGATHLSVVGRGPNERLARERAERTRDAMLRRIEDFEASSCAPWSRSRGLRPTLSVEATFDEQGYTALVERAKEHIFAGDIFEVCLTHRLTSPTTADPWALYHELRAINPAPFACYLRLPEADVVSSSPERFLRLSDDGTAESRPIKGTRPRGATPEEDLALSRDLAQSPKDQAENNMIVDLVRSDFGRVCRFGTVQVPELRIIEAYSTVYQMVSTIRGQLDDGKSGIELIRACFPGGSMTGAPKIEAMKIIDRLEPVKRGIYGGSIGYIDFSGTLDLNIVIRTIVMRGKRAYYNVGGAIVADSDPRSEYMETLDKARALIVALQNVAGTTA
jgi:aminodeoxychorismate synthase component I